ncbi:hypothetical protein ABT56_11170 [Photobacterium aquae]|uniref:Uncharacterized protein n=1 Tax=Photobacterium aquae TaxID=1195763 RepID=A0A0J1H127_9GAMM|nr:hypothetical protein [Photobacterium aquae]KLV05523.1 hypothetical protein ABT56_11170 [Photobacterium aquae]
MNKKIFPIILLLFSTSAFSYGIHTNLNLEWMKENHRLIEMDLKNRKTNEIIKDLNTLTNIWIERDGAVSGEVSPLLIIAIEKHTDFTLSILSSHPRSFNKWLNELEGIVFTDFNGDQKEKLLKMKKSLSDSLVIYLQSEPSESLKPFALELLKKTNEISVSQIN